jgi:hypothetical protein
MFFTGRSKQLPNLSDYLDKKIQEQRSRGSRIGIAGGIIGTTAGLIGALFGILAGLGAITFSTTSLVVTIILLNLVCWLAILGYHMYEKKKMAAEKPAERKHQAEAEAIVVQMYQALYRKRLHKELDDSAGALLEDCGRNYMRIQNTLSMPFWMSDELPGHWRAVRDQSLLAAEQAMDEALVMLKGSFHPGRRKGNWEEIVEDVMSEFTQPAKRRPVDHLSPGFRPAREIAEKLKLLASEVERATGDLAKDEAIAEEFTAGASLEMALSELKTIQVAEDELRQNLHG